MSAKNVIISLLTVLIAFSIFISCTTVKKSSTVNSSSENRDTSSSKPATASAKEFFNEATVSSFHPISDNIDKTFYENNQNAYSSRKIEGNYDFNGDSNNENFSINYQYTKNGSLPTEIVIGNASLETHLLGFAGAYSIKPSDADSIKLLAIVEYDSDNFIYTHFYKYSKKDGSEDIIDLGQLDGSVNLNPSIQKHSNEFNEVIMSDSKGKLIPRFSLIKYLTPSIILNVYSYENDAILRSSQDNNDISSNDYSVSFDTSPYFEQGNMNSATYMPKAKKSDIINLKRGEKISVLNISNKVTNQEVALVRLENGKQGLLYYFINPY